jgi:hypothetical protein
VSTENSRLVGWLAINRNYFSVGKTSEEPEEATMSYFRNNVRSINQGLFTGRGKSDIFNSFFKNGPSSMSIQWFYTGFRRQKPQQSGHICYKHQDSSC